MMGSGHALQGVAGNIGYDDGQLARYSTVSVWPSLPKAGQLPAERFWCTLNRIVGTQMGIPDNIEVRHCYRWLIAGVADGGTARAQSEQFGE
jgi:hypothetical protein